MRTLVSPGFDEAAWSAVPVSSALHSTRWLRAMASRVPGAPHTVTHQSGLALFGAVVTDPDAYEAYNPYAVLWRDPPVFDVADPAARRDGLAGLGGTVDRLLPALVLVAPGYDGDPAGPAADDPAVLTECLRDVVDWAREHGLGGVYPLYTRSPAVTGAVAALGGASFPLTSRWALPVWWDDWESYLDGLGGKRRREIARQRRRLAESGGVLGPVALAERFAEVLDCRCALLRRYGQHADVTAERARLSRLREAFGDDLDVHGVFHDGALVACSVSVRHGRSAHVVYAGATDAGHALPYAHFGAVFYAVVERTGRDQLDEVDYGIGHGEGKALRGCAHRALSGHAIGLDPATSDLLHGAARLLARSPRPSHL